MVVRLWPILLLLLGVTTGDPGPGAARRIAGSVEHLLGVPDEELTILRDGVHRFAASNWKRNLGYGA